MRFSVSKQQRMLDRMKQRARRSALILFVLIASAELHAAEEDLRDGWYFTAEEIGAAYLYQENYGERLRNPLRARSCMFRGGEFAARNGKTAFTTPCRFVQEVTRHLKEMIEAGAAKFLFPLDADHAHLGVPMAAWNEKYRHLPPEEVIPALLRDPGLVALYHTAEHLKATDRKTGAINPQAQEWIEKRNVLGYFDGRPIEILPPHPEGQGASMPEGYYAYSGFSFLASPRGELYLPLGTKIIAFDIALDATPNDEDQDVFGSTRLTRNNR